MELHADIGEDMMEQSYDFGIYLLERNPFIKLLAISGSLASNDTEKHGDNDFFIVSKEDRVWECFAACIFYGFVYSKKIHKPRQFFCFNYLIDKNHVEEEIKIDKMSAREFLNLKVIYGNDLYKKILKNKQAIEDFYPAEYRKKLKDSEDDIIIKPSNGLFFIFIKPFFRVIAKIFEYGRKRRHKSSKIYSNNHVIRSHLHN